MILITGDSNFRELFNNHKQKLEDETGEVVVFKQYSTNESLRLILKNAGDSEEVPKVYVIGAGLNECAARVQKATKKKPEDIVKAIANEQNTVVQRQAEKDSKSIFVLVPPFIRKDPKWMIERSKTLLTYMNEFCLTFTSGNMFVGSTVGIVVGDLVTDGVHLAPSGLLKLADRVVADAVIVLKDVAILRGDVIEEDAELQSSQLSDWSKTPVTTRKRVRDDDDPTPEPDRAEKRTKENEESESGSLIDTLKQFMKEIREDRNSDKDMLKKVETTQSTIVEKQKATDKKVDELTTIVSADSTIFASMKEDVDAAENDFLRSNVVVKKLVTDEVVPSDRKDLSKFVQRKGRELVDKILGDGSEKEVKFVSTLFIRENRVKEKDEPNFVPPFKLVFKTKEMGIQFREKAVQMSKEGQKDLEKTYFAHQQNAATRIRTSLMWGVVAVIKKSGKDAWVNQNLNKPNIQIKEGGKIVKTLTFIQAMNDYGKKINAKTLSDVAKSAKWNFGGQLERYFVVLKD
jgi:hypothetical protein